MRSRAVAAIVLLLLPAGLSAQRIPSPRPGRAGPARPTPLPPQPAPIARELAYKRLRVSVESYPLVSVVRAPGFLAEGGVAGWTSFGLGTRTAYRIKPYLSATLDMTASFLGGPATTETAELGMRFGPERWDQKTHPFVDVRAGYMHAHDTFFRPIDNSIAFPTQQGMRGARYSHGVGGVAGAGVEHSLSRTFSLTSAVSVMRNQMTAYRYSGAGMGSDGRYWMTSYRFTLGLRYNPVRLMQGQGTVTP